jgi:DNA-binding protein YbaB
MTNSYARIGMNQLETFMSSTSDPSLSSLLEKANYIKKAMGNLEEEITKNVFTVRKNGIQVEIRGTHKIEKIFLDPDSPSNKLAASDLLGHVQTVINMGVEEIENRRQEAFKMISQNIQDPPENSKT